MAAAPTLRDDALVVRGRRVPFQSSLRDGCDFHYETGDYGFSVQSANGRTIQELASYLPLAQVGHTTVAEIRSLGYDVVSTPGRGLHATVIVPENWSEEAADQVARLFRGARNDSPRRRR
jgi:hypothetical protein